MVFSGLEVKPFIYAQQTTEKKFIHFIFFFHINFLIWSGWVGRIVFFQTLFVPWAQVIYVSLWYKNTFDNRVLTIDLRNEILKNSYI